MMRSQQSKESAEPQTCEGDRRRLCDLTDLEPENLTRGSWRVKMPLIATKEEKEHFRALLLPVFLLSYFYQGAPSLSRSYVKYVAGATNLHQRQKRWYGLQRTCGAEPLPSNEKKDTALGILFPLERITSERAKTIDYRFCDVKSTKQGVGRARDLRRR